MLARLAVVAPRPHILTKRLGAKRLPDKRVAVGVAALIIASLVTTVALAGPVKPATWNPRYVTQYPPLGNHSQFDAVITQPGQAWFFGGSNVTGTTGVPKILYRSGGRWLPPPAPLPNGLTSYIIAASAVSPTNMWVVTRFGGAALFWNGLQWTQAPNGGWSIGSQFTGITVVGLSDVWLFGSASGGYLGAGTWHLTPAGWKQVLGAATYLNRASATGPGDIWAIGGARGSMRALAHYDGTAWARVQPRALAGFRYSYVLALTADDVWVAGSVAGQPKLGHFNGHRWTTRSVPGTHAATGMCRDGTGGLWVIANTGTSPSVVRHLSKSGRWSVARVSTNKADEVLACAQVPGRKAAWGAGQADGPQGKGTAAAAYGTGDVP
jgi:hypothetical protein